MRTKKTLKIKRGNTVILTLTFIGYFLSALSFHLANMPEPEANGNVPNYRTA